MTANKYRKGSPQARAGLDHIALVEAVAACTPQERHHAQEIRARLDLRVASSRTRRTTSLRVAFP